MKDKLKKFWANHNEAIAVMVGSVVGGFAMGMYHKKQIHNLEIAHRTDLYVSYSQGYNEAIDQVVSYDEKLFPKIFGGSSQLTQSS